MKERYKLLILVLVFWAGYFVPWDSEVVRRSGLEAFLMFQEYTRDHILTCLIPAFFIAGAVSVFVSQASVLKYFGPQANKILSYSVASVSGTILAVCSCTVLPLFAGIYTRGAGIGPATAFLYSGPAINVLAIVFTAKVLGWKLGLARAIGAVCFAFVVGLLMAFIFRESEAQRESQIYLPEDLKKGRPLWKEALFMLDMVLILIFASLAKPASNSKIWLFLFFIKWYVVVVLLLILGSILKSWYEKEEIKLWIDATWRFMKQIFPLLFGGVLVAGFLFGRPGHQGLIPPDYVYKLVGGNSLWSNFFASIVGALMYFATLTEVPILQGLIGAGMGQGPALALLLAGPALSLPNLIVIASIMGWKKALTYVSIVVVLSTIVGVIYGCLVT